MDQAPLQEEHLPDDPTPPPASSRKSILLFAVLLIVLMSIVGVIYAYVGNFMNPASPSPIPTQPTAKVSQAISPSSTPTATQSGTITGKLCFPSEGIPPGNVTAKNTQTQILSTVLYSGTSAGGGTTYSVPVAPGSYIMRFEVPYENGNFSRGYHTTACPTGVDESCIDRSKRTNIVVTVQNGQTVQNVDICDFYYAEESEPDF